MPAYHPPFQLTHRVTAAMTQIAELLGAWKAVNQNTLLPELRRGNRIRTIQASLAVEQNTLTLEQVTVVLDGKIVMGSPRKITAIETSLHEAINLEMRAKTRVQTRVKTPQQVLELLKQHPEFSLAGLAALAPRGGNP